jgi:hypothetical protein
MAGNDRTLTALNDPELRPFLTATGEPARSAALDVVMRDVARPIISRVLQRCRRAIAAAGARDTDDIEAAVLLRVVQKLESARGSEDDAVARLDEYVARLTFNAVADVRRESAPEWSRLKRRLRYVAMSDERLAAWDVPAGTLCGLAAWRERVDAVEHFRLPAGLPPPLRDQERPGEALLALLRIAGAPLPLDSVTTTLAELWGVEEPLARPLDDDFADAAQGPVALYETREELQIVWDEIRALPMPQRVALLLNLRDGIGLNAAALFPLTGVASFDDIAAAMEMPVEQLAAIWPRLPLADIEIAGTLRVERQQVINLRKTARARLQRRIARRQKGREGR